jgi:hypothetical protein
VKALVVLVVLVMLTPGSVLAYKYAVMTDASSKGVGSPILIAALVYDSTTLGYEVSVRYSDWFGCNWDTSLTLPQPGHIVGLSVENRADYLGTEAYPCVLLSYADGKTFISAGTICNDCPGGDICERNGDWDLLYDFDFGLVGTGVEPTEQVPGLPRLNNYPNPFSDSTELSFEIQKSDDAVITIYNVAGQRICSIERTNLTPGWHSFLWDGRDDSGKRLASGTYFFTVQTSAGNSTRKIILLK